MRRLSARQVFTLFIGMLIGVLIYKAAAMVFPIEPVNQAAVPSYKSFILIPGDGLHLYYGQNLSDKKMSITKVDLVTGANTTPFGEGWIDTKTVKIEGYTFKQDNQGMLNITSYSWDDGISVWDINQFGEFDLKGDFIIFSAGSNNSDSNPSSDPENTKGGCWGIWMADFLPGTLCHSTDN